MEQTYHRIKHCRHIILMMVCLFVFNDSKSAVLQESPISSIVFSRLRNSIGQSFKIDSIIPMDYIDSQWKEGYHIYQLSAGENGIGLYMNLGRIPQKVSITDTIPSKEIQDYLALGYRITSLASSKGKWYIVYTIDNSIYAQSLIIHNTFPTDQIQQKWNEGYRISSVEYGYSQWIVIMNRMMFTSAQNYALSDTLPRQSIQTLKRKNLSLSHIYDVGGAFCTVGDQLQVYDQLLLSDKSITLDTINYYWKNGYTITSLSMKRYPTLQQVRNTAAENIIHSIDLSQIPTSEQELSQYHNHIQHTAPSESALLAIQKIAAYYFLQENNQSAIQVYQTYKVSMKGFEARIDSSIALFQKKTDSIIVENLRMPVNTRGSEWDPIPSPDGSALYMSVRDRIGGEGRQDVFVAKKGFDSNQRSFWEKPISVGPGVNSSMGEETVDNVSSDGNTLLLSGTFPGSYGRFDIYTAERTESGWDNLRQLPRPVNTEFHDESGCLSSDGKVLLFASDRPGGIGTTGIPMGTKYHAGSHGNMDIYACIKTDTGWSEPINLGKTVNTPFAERSLFLHPDGRTLYFSSDGHYGLGGLDVFKTTRLHDNSWTEWSVPQNLGRNINTVEDDFSYKITVGGDTAYFAAQNKPGGLGDWDIYRVIIPKDIRPMPVATVKGTVVNTKGKPLHAEIIWEDLESKKRIGSSTTNPQDGSYFIVLPLGKHYGYYAQAQGYFPSSSNINLQNQKKSISKTKNIVLSALPDSTNNKVVLQLSNVFFDYDNDSVKSESYPELQRIAMIIKNSNYTQIEISGHTDDIGSKAFNKRLSERRANNVKDYLLKQGINSSLLKARGYGSEKPKAIGTLEEDRALNRRVELLIVK